MAFAGCGAAYYGTAIAIFATQSDDETIDTSFPDAVPTAPVTAPFATLRLSTEQVTLSRTDTGGIPAEGVTTSTLQDTTDFEVLGVDFPAGYGESRSNRDTNQTLVSGDKLFVRINGDTPRELNFDTGDVASIGSGVAAAIQSKVRTLTPSTTGVSANAYSLFTANYDATTGSYRFVSGHPGESSEVVFQPEPRANTNDPTPDTASQATATRLGLGVDNGGVELSGGESVRVQVLNRGTDVINAGTLVKLYLSRDKVLDAEVDPQFDEVAIPETIAVGESRLVTRKNGSAPPLRLLRSDFKADDYYVLYSVDTSGGETITSNNTTFSLRTVEVYQPVDDPSTTAVEAFNDLDFVPVRSNSPISLVASDTLTTSVTLSNRDLAVPTGGRTIDIDLALSADTSFDEPAYFADASTNTTKVAGVRVNPTVPSRAITITIDDAGGNSGVTASVFANTITVQFNGTATPAVTVQAMIDALNSSQGGLVDAFHDGVGSTGDSLSDLVQRLTSKTATAQDIYVTTRQVTYAQTTQPAREQSFSLSGTVRNTIQSTSLPAKLIPFFKITPTVPSGEQADNTRNNTRQASNFLRVYSRTDAFFDTNTGVRLPTTGSTDFAQLDAVTQRPVNTGSIQQGQQRVFSFELPDTTATNDESQLLVVLRSDDFDAHLDLLSGTGRYITGSDDNGLGTNPIVYAPASAAGNNRTFYLVVSPARFDESDLTSGNETFELTISVNSKQGTDTALLNGVKADNLLNAVKARYEPPTTAPRIENDVLIPFSLANRKAEVMFVLPQRARVRIASKPVATSGTTVTITSFLQNQVPSPVDFQAVLDPVASRIVYRPSGGDVDTSHLLEPGVYTVAFEAGLADTQSFRLELETEFITDTQE